MLNLNEKEIIDMYSNNKISYTKIAKIFNCSTTPIKKILKEDNIKIRPPEFYFKGKKSPKRLDLDETQVIELYSQKIRPLKIAKQFNCSVFPIYKILKKNKINLWGIEGYGHTEKTKMNLRDKAKLKIGEKNPFYGKKHSSRTIKIIKEKRAKQIITEEHRKNLSLAFSGKKNPMYGKSGDLSPNWQGCLSFEPYDKSFNNKFKRAIRKRDNYICLKCMKHQEKLSKSLSVHHINYDKKMSIPQNCCSLCPKCHSEVNFNRKHWMKFFQSLLNEKYNYQYSETKEIILEVKNENQIHN